MRSRNVLTSAQLPTDGEVVGRGQHFAGRRAPVSLAASVDAADVGRHSLVPLRNFLDVLRDVARSRRSAARDRSGNRGGDFVHLGDRRPDRLRWLVDRVAGLLLDRGAIWR